MNQRNNSAGGISNNRVNFNSNQNNFVAAGAGVGAANNGGRTNNFN